MKRIATKNAPAALGPYAQAVDTGTTVDCSGQLGLDTVTGALAEGVQAQTHQALKNLQAVLGEAGLTLDSVVKTTVFVQDLGDFGAVNAANLDGGTSTAMYYKGKIVNQILRLRKLPTAIVVMQSTEGKGSHG